MDFVRRFETWVYNHDSESKDFGSEAIIRAQKSAQKVLASVFLDAKVILFFLWIISKLVEQ